MQNATVVNKPSFINPLAALFHIHPRPNLTKHQIELKIAGGALAKKRKAERREELRGKCCETWNTPTLPKKHLEANIAKVVADVPTHNTPLTDAQRKLLKGVGKE
jgi:hypothetical protein